MKEQAIQKINKIGKISSVITLIAKIIVSMGLVLALIGAIICFAIPDSLFKMSFAGDLVMEVDYSSLGVSMSEADILESQKSMELNISGQEYEFSEVEITESMITMKADLDNASFTMKDIAYLDALALVALAMTFVTLVFIGGLCKAFRDCQSPFEENVIKKMQNLAISLIPWAVVSTVTNSISDSLMNHKLSLNFTVDLGVVLIVLVVLVLVYIFKYGAVLQQESDETL